MTAKQTHYLKLSVLAALLWILYLVPWFPLAWVEPLKPTITSVAFVVLAQRLRVASWPVVVAFSLAFFVEGIAEAYANSPTLREPSSDGFPVSRPMMLALWAVLFSPVSLWGPVLFSAMVYGVIRERRDADPQ